MPPETATAKKKRLRLQRRGYRLLATYGITNADYDALLAKQGGTCAICNEKRAYFLHVDHDHSVADKRASVRGLLCKRCNKLLAQVGDSRNLLKAAAYYLMRWPSKGVL